MDALEVHKHGNPQKPASSRWFELTPREEEQLTAARVTKEEERRTEEEEKRRSEEEKRAREVKMVERARQDRDERAEASWIRAADDREAAIKDWVKREVVTAVSAAVATTTREREAQRAQQQERERQGREADRLSRQAESEVREVLRRRLQDRDPREEVRVPRQTERPALARLMREHTPSSSHEEWSFADLTEERRRTANEREAQRLAELKKSLGIERLRLQRERIALRDEEARTRQGASRRPSREQGGPNRSTAHGKGKEKGLRAGATHPRARKRERGIRGAPRKGDTERRQPQLGLWLGHRGSGVPGTGPAGPRRQLVTQSYGC